MKPEPFAPWQCPLCGEPLTGDTALKCGRNHSFDRAKEGYWHLLPVQSMRTKAPGDSKEMVAARRAFLTPGITASSAGCWGNCALRTALPPGQMRRSICWMRARRGLVRPLHCTGLCAGGPAGAAGGLISQSLRCVWPQRHCLPQNTRWHPVCPACPHRMGRPAAQLFLALCTGRVPACAAPGRTDDLCCARCGTPLPDELSSYDHAL